MNDFKNNVLTFKGKPVRGLWLCMVQGEFCGYCTQAKPEFIKAMHALTNKALFCTIKIDGSDDEQKLGKELKNVTSMPMNGVPAFILFYNGKPVELYKDKRDADSLINFINSKVHSQ